MSKNLTQASYEWGTRPADERFSTLQEMWLHCMQQSVNSTSVNVLTPQIKAKAVGNTMTFQANGTEFLPNNLSFGQIATVLNGKMDFLCKLSPKVLESTLNDRLETANAPVQLYYNKHLMKLRAVTGQGYGRIMNHDIVHKLTELKGNWVTPPARPAFDGQPGTRIATEADCKGSNHPSLSIKPGDVIAPAGLYAGDRDMFAFMVDPTKIVDDGTDGGLARGFMIWNSEVGDKSFGLLTFLYRYVCGNHIVWDAEEVAQTTVKHVGPGANFRAFDAIERQLKVYAEASVENDVLMIKSAKTKELWPGMSDAIDDLFRTRKILGKKEVESAWLSAEQNEVDGSPSTVWGMVNGITRMSQQSRYADQRTMLDKAANKLLLLAK